MQQSDPDTELVTDSLPDGAVDLGLPPSLMRTVSTVYPFIPSSLHLSCPMSLYAGPGTTSILVRRPSIAIAVVRCQCLLFIQMASGIDRGNARYSQQVPHPVCFFLQILLVGPPPGMGHHAITDRTRFPISLHHLSALRHATSITRLVTVSPPKSSAVRLTLYLLQASVPGAAVDEAANVPWFPAARLVSLVRLSPSRGLYRS